KRRYSGFIGTDFEIVLSGLKASTLILIGGLTDVCVHYTFADAVTHHADVEVALMRVGGSSQYRHDAALDAMEYLQTGALRTTDEILDAFAAVGATP
ncbi:cysteine hydrolase, partial [Mycobacterium sp. ITM-2017-0098]